MLQVELCYQDLTINPRQACTKSDNITGVGLSVSLSATMQAATCSSFYVQSQIIILSRAF